MRVLHVTGTLGSRAAGVAAAVGSLVIAQRELGVDARIVTEDQGPGWWPAILAGAVGRSDVVHVHGLWMRSTALAGWLSAGLRRPIVLASHGMLDPWALSQSSRKKALARATYLTSLMRRAACLHALCVPEAEAMRTLGLENPIALVPPGLPVEAADRQVSRERLVLFLGRLHSKKGIDLLLRGFHLARAAERMWKLVIAGPDEGGIAESLRALAETLGIRGAVEFPGALYGAEKRAMLARAGIFALTSHSEGLPVAILEAMAQELPVLASRQCNLPELEAAGAGVVVETRAESVAEGLGTLLNLEPASRSEMGRRGRALFEREFSASSTAARMLGVYEWVLGLSERPACMLLSNHGSKGELR